MDLVELALTLGEVPGIGPRTLAAVLRRGAVLRLAPDDVLRLPAGDLASALGIHRPAAEALASSGSRLAARAAQDARMLRRAGVRVVTLLDATYPRALLSRLDDPPPVVFASGDLSVLERPLFAVATSNDAPEAALRAGDAAAEAAVAAGWAPLTGHNRVAYQRPALVARRHGAPIGFVLDRGIAEAFGGDYRRDLFAALRIWPGAERADRDLALSTFGIRDHGSVLNNRRRDALIFALSQAVFATCVRPRGEMERHCLRALRSGRPVYLVGGNGGASEPLARAGAAALDPLASNAVCAALQTVALGTPP
ncbi:MAG: hypothetical protein IT208_12185 [Chthonomonadales bacterium]|nr:hypothetical protein [Chthonomonadales bacterium]